MIPKLLPLSMLTIALQGCAITEISSYTDPDYRAYKSRRIVVSAPGSDIELGSKLEKYISRELAKRNVTAMPMGDIVNPARQSNSEYIKVNLKPTEADSLLLILLNGANFDKNIISTYTTANSTIYPNYSYRNGRTSSYSLATNGTDNNTLFNVKLYEIKSGKVVWSSDARANSKHKFPMDEEAAISDLAKALAKELTKSEHIGEMLSKNDED